jgi:ribosomal protein S18 acetylase RimI-like enzyme
VSRVSARVRPATREDVPALVDLLSQIDTSSGTFSGRAPRPADVDHLAARLTAVLEDGSRTLLVAVEETTGALAGLLAARTDEIGMIDVTPALHITHLLVTPEHRRRGVGRALLAGAVHLADEQGLDRVLATVAASSREGNRYLARLGFAPMVIERVVGKQALRKALGLADGSERVAVMRRAMLGRGRRPGLATPKVVGRGA